MDNTCANPSCDNTARDGSKYCHDECRKTTARSRYLEREGYKATKGVDNAITAEEFERSASKLLTTRVPLPDPPNKVLAMKKEDMGFDTTQHAVACFSDYHFGSEVDPRVTGGIGGYNVEIARKRLAMWRDGVLRFTQIMQLTVDVPVLHILANGDDMEGNGHMFGTQALQMEISPWFQYLGFVADMTDVLVSLLSRFEKIHIYKVFGNHGRMSGNKKQAFDPDNIELMAWMTIAARCELAAPGRFSFDISSSFFQVVDILGQVHLQRHGDGVNLNSTYCVTPETRILTDDLRWVPAGSLEEGDGILAFDEEPGSYKDKDSEGKWGTRTHRKYTRAIITHAERKTARVWRVTLEDGTVLRATGEHKWLMYPSSNAGPAVWRTTEDLQHMIQKGEWRLARYLSPWESKRDYEEGFLAGAFDADGSITAGDSLTARFTQYDNPLLSAVEQALSVKDFSTRKNESEGTTEKQYQVSVLGRLREQLRFLGTVRPPRLLSKWEDYPIEERNVEVEKKLRVVSVELEGAKRVASLTSSSATYFAEGFGAHNTGVVDNKLAFNSILGQVIPIYVIAHHHTATEREEEIDGDTISNGCFVGPSLLALRMRRPRANRPSQELWFIHPRKGVTARNRIHLATAEEVRQVNVVSRS